MGVWNTLRRFAERRGMARTRGSRSNRRRATGVSRPRDLRVEQFEDRVLLSIGSTTSESDAYWNQTLGQMIERASDLTRYSTQQLAGVTKWAVGVSDPASAVQLANSLGADLLGPAPNLPNGFVWQFDGQHSAQEISQRLKSATGVSYEYPLITVKPELLMIPNDPLFVDQWHLLNTGQGGGLVGADANVTPAWDSVTGAGVVIGIVDDEVQLTHPDLAPHYRSDLDYDFNFNDADPSPDNPLDNHGTAVAGVAAAAGNNALGVTGAGFEAELAGLRLISSDPNAAFNDALLATALDYNNQSIDIYNNSWGFIYPLYDGTFYPMGVAALRNGALTGRGGLGSIYVFSAGNSGATQDNVNYYAMQNSRYVIAVGAIDNLGVSSWYSTPGAAVLVSAYSNGGSLGITTTDRTGDDGYNLAGAADGDPLADTNYTSTFGGTSSAAPLVSGIVALMLEANPNLSWRDVQVILATTAKKDRWDRRGVVAERRGPLGQRQVRVRGGGRRGCRGRRADMEVLGTGGQPPGQRAESQHHDPRQRATRTASPAR